MQNDIAQIITAMAALVAAIGSAAAVLMSFRNGMKIEEVRKATNGMTAQLLKVTGESEHAKGVIQGEASPKSQP